MRNAAGVVNQYAQNDEAGADPDHTVRFFSQVAPSTATDLAVRPLKDLWLAYVIFDLAKNGVPLV